MNTVTVKAYGKVNLSLDITGKKENGYHEVEMIMQQISLHDILTIKRIDQGIRLTSKCAFIPKDQRNIAYKVAKALMDAHGLEGGLHIDIQKNIPVAAGLAGGSADAAGVIEGINMMFDLGLTLEDMQAFALPFGADIPFCLKGGTAIARGIGEMLEVIHGLDGQWLILVKPNIGVSTESVYKQFSLEGVLKHPDTERLTRALAEKDMKTLSFNMYNVLQEITGKNYPIIGVLEKKLKSFGAMGVMMSGSGPTVFGVFKNHKTASKAYRNMAKTEREVFLVQGYQGGNHCE